jgi:hypothetical protein
MVKLSWKKIAYIVKIQTSDNRKIFLKILPILKVLAEAINKYLIINNRQIY